ncbi:MAG: M20/M25/M40 family metallo-hydrolase [Melioribacteraceae bacterium]|nr:M20/M25/M40 family metallo-hydrolase [Melioribacteraceae bacterium]MCF8353846.1 M20/M25/M40 family metallo-hydrolase [Melioribacteraceae bacterium]MCF8393079.1 M20/M25/M40 family metallo-hydrolase [Melioribacteraceae bacterium]MCF8419198.1 M20/M25/M40 family metallo-hydrolase [Melioribacteraceae bacterium]
MKKYSTGLFLFILLQISVSAQLDKQTSIVQLKSNLEFLADDLLEGREATQHGEKIASLFISKELQKYGIEPFGDSGTYFQEFDLQVTGISDGANIVFNHDGTESIIVSGEDIVISRRGGLPSEKFSGLKGEIVFAGYGISSEEKKYDDYSGLDVKNKIVLVLSGIPSSEAVPGFTSEDMRRFDSRYKRKLAAEKGAVGIISIISESWMQYWDFIAGSAFTGSYSLPSNEDDEPSDLIPAAIANLDAAKYLFEQEVYSYDDIKAKLDSNEIIEPFQLSKTAQFNFGTYNELRSARNIIGILPGNNEVLKSEYVTIGGHYDHVGVSGDQVYNGADDNGSGTVAILETARQLALNKNNERSIVFIFHTAEEKGLLGAKYLTSNSDWIENAVVNINIDMVGRESVDSLYSIGSDKLSSELKEIVEEVNYAGGYFTLDYRFDDPGDPNRFYYRSDHVHYANRNIPIVFFYDYMQTDYHKATDTVEKINFEKIYKVTKLVGGIAVKIANKESRLALNEAEE